MKLHCPLCGEECLSESVNATAYARNLICIECGARCVVFLGEQLIMRGTADGHLGATEQL